MYFIYLFFMWNLNFVFHKESKIEHMNKAEIDSDTQRSVRGRHKGGK